MSLHEDLKWFIANCTIIGLLPPVRSGVLTTRRIIFAMHFLLFCAIVAAYIQVGANMNAISALFNNSTTKLLQMLLMNTIVINFAVTTHVVRIKQLQKMLDCIHKFDLQCGSKEKVTIRNSRKIFLLTSGVSTILLIISTILYLLKAKITVLTFIVLGIDLTCKYFYNVIVYFLMILLYSLSLRIKRLNSITMQLDANMEAEYVDYLTKMADCIYDAVGLFNYVFGWTLLLVYVHMVLYALRLMHVFIVIIDTNQWIRILQITINCLQPFIQGVIVAALCEKVVDEGKKTITLSYKALYRYNNAPVIKEKLWLLAQQATARCPKFSAAGFFSVDFSMLFTFVNIITTYVIVIIQFSQNGNGCTSSTGIQNSTDVHV